MFNIRSNKALFNMFSITILLITFNNVSHISMKYLGLASITIFLLFNSLILMYSFTKTLNIIKYKKGLVFFYITFIVLMTIGVLINISQRAIITQMQFILLINYFLVFSMIKYEEKLINTKIIFLVLSIFLSIFYIGLITINPFETNYKSIYSNPNVLGLFAIMLFGISKIIYMITNKKIYKIYSFVYVPIIILTGARTSILSFILIVSFNLLFDLFTKNRIKWNLVLLIFIVAMTIIIYVYLNIESYFFFEQVNSLVFSITGKRILSGRNIIWKQAFELIKQKPWMGYGTGTTLSSLNGITLSAHNLYIQIMIQNGLIGIFLFLSIIIAIWNILYYGKEDRIVKLCSSFLLGTLAINMFEVTFLQNNLSVAIMQWFFISVGVSRALNKSKTILTDTKTG